MKLVQVHVVRTQPPQRLLQFLCCLVLRALPGLAGKENRATVGLKGRPQALLRIAVTRRDIEVADPTLDRLCYQAAGGSRLLIHHQDAAKANHRELLTGSAQRTLIHDALLPQTQPMQRPTAEPAPHRAEKLLRRQQC